MHTNQQFYQPMSHYFMPCFSLKLFFYLWSRNWVTNQFSGCQWQNRCVGVPSSRPAQITTPLQVFSLTWQSERHNEEINIFLWETHLDSYFQSCHQVEIIRVQDKSRIITSIWKPSKHLSMKICSWNPNTQDIGRRIVNSRALWATL